MPIKQIQLRGISRTPSDRMTSDGGCAESLNVHLEENEIAPTLAPEYVNEELGLPLNTNKPFVYIHKVTRYTNYITFETGTAFGWYHEDSEWTQIAELEEDETFVSASSIGNTLIVMTDKHSHYALFKDNSYIYLGNKIPMPSINISPTPVHGDAAHSLELQVELPRNKDGQSQTNPTHYLAPSDNIDMETWNTAAGNAESSISAAGYPGPQLGRSGPTVTSNETFLSLMKANKAEIEDHAKQLKCFVNQIFVMYAIRLYNDTYITSVPYLMPGGFEDPYYYVYSRESTGVVDLAQNTYEFSDNKEYLFIGARYPYKVSVKLDGFGAEELEKWKDVIRSINFFITPTIPYNIADEKFVYITKQVITPVRTITELSATRTEYYNKCSVEMRPTSEAYAQDYINRVLDQTDFRLIETIELDGKSYASRNRLSQLREGTMLSTDDYIAGTGQGDDYVSGQDNLEAKTPLADLTYQMKNTEKIAENASNINNRLVMNEVTEMLDSGSLIFPAAKCTIPNAVNWRDLHIEESYHVPSYDPLTDIRWDSSFIYPEPLKTVSLAYHIRGSSDLLVHGRFGPNGSISYNNDEYDGFFGFLIYPDARCYAVDVFLGYDSDTGTQLRKKTYEMQPHPGLDCAYAYIGVDKNLLWDVGCVQLSYNAGTGNPEYSVDDASIEWGEMPEEDREDKVTSKLYLSDTDNPWFFPVSSLYTMQGDSTIVGFAAATKALSEGQFGQFDLYVFTENGIHAMKMNSDGTFGSSHLVSRDVAIGGTITPVDQSVVFLTSRGLMLLTGSDIVNLSPYMNGKHYALSPSDEIYELLDNEMEVWSELLPAISDDTHFMSYMKNAKIVYDYVGERLICLNTSKPYAYVYMMRTQTWHKMMLANNSTETHILNSYPDAYISTIENNASNILNLSTVLDVTSTQAVSGIIITRPFDLDEPDIRKEIKDIRIRGQFNRKDVMYILMGSLDGIHWKRLTSLRGGSFKLFRLVLLTSLSPTERISWIDVEYESRFTNRLR